VSNTGHSIGGVDLIVQGARRGDADAVVAALARHWPDAVAHDLDSSPVPASAAKLHGAELFVYRDRESFDSWQREGATPANAASMVHIVIGPNSMTVVTDEEAEGLRDMIRETVRETA
jgi:hypothetical protein